MTTSKRYIDFKIQRNLNIFVMSTVSSTYYSHVLGTSYFLHHELQIIMIPIAIATHIHYNLDIHVHQITETC